MKNKYDESFKLHVVQEYYKSELGIRFVSKAFNLPTKNYLTRWIAEMKEKGLIPESLQKDSSKPHKGPFQQSDISQNHIASRGSTPLEKQLEKENLRLRAEVDFLKKLHELQRGSLGKI